LGFVKDTRELGGLAGEGEVGGMGVVGGAFAVGAEEVVGFWVIRVETFSAWSLANSSPRALNSLSA